MWVLTGERERFCCIHIIGKSIRALRLRKNMPGSCEGRDRKGQRLCPLMEGTRVGYWASKSGTGQDNDLILKSDTKS
jgi:hypothetical protein